MTVLHLRPNTWLRRITDRWELIKVVNVGMTGRRERGKTEVQRTVHATRG